jgi:hypothetical protein
VKNYTVEGNADFFFLQFLTTIMYKPTRDDDG